MNAIEKYYNVGPHRSLIAEQIQRGQPFIFTGGMNGEFAANKLNIESLVEKYGENLVRISEIIRFLPFATKMMSVREYVEKMEAYLADQSTSSNKLPPILPYVFHDDLGIDEQNYASNLSEEDLAKRDGGTQNSWEIARKCPPPWFLKLVISEFPCTAARVALGPNQSHCGLHWHGIAANMLAFGRKRWFLHPPQTTEMIFEILKRIKSNSHQMVWLHRFHSLAEGSNGDIADAVRETAWDLAQNGEFDWPENEDFWMRTIMADELRGLEFYQEPGDTVFVPDGWGHWVINESWTLAVIYECVSRETRDKYLGSTAKQPN